MYRIITELLIYVFVLACLLEPVAALGNGCWECGLAIWVMLIVGCLFCIICFVGAIAALITFVKWTMRKKQARID
jgi:hypothetical protein